MSRGYNPNSWFAQTSGCASLLLLYAGSDMADVSETIRCRFGEREYAGGLPTGMVFERLEPAVCPHATSADAIIRHALGNPIASPCLSDIARGGRSAAILISGKDRVAAADIYVPLLLDELNQAGIPDDAIEVFIATGTHARHSDEDALALLGEKVLSRVAWQRHDCTAPDKLQRVGVTKYGNEVFLNRRVLAADVKVLTGRIIPHYFAGFSGGRKTLVPGVAGFETIKRNHRLTLAPDSGIDTNCRACFLDANPVHLDMLEGAGFVKGTFLLNTLLDTEHQVVDAFAGDMAKAHLAGCAEAERIFKVTVEAPFDAMIAAAGGAPYDCNFMQAIKAFFAVKDAVRPGGAILCVAQCPAGMKDAFLEWARIKSDDELEKAVRSNYNLAGHNSIMLRRLTRKFRIALWSDLPDQKVRAMRIEPVRSLDQGLAWLFGVSPGNARRGIAPYANITYATCLQESR